MDHQELVTVIVLSYGPSDFYWHTLQSVLQQDYCRIEIIVSDDGSGKFDAAQVEVFINKHKRLNIERVVVRENEQNLGICRHDNLVASFAQGQFIKFIADGDSFIDSTSLCKLVEFAELHEEAVVTSPCYVCSADLGRKYYQFPSARRIRILNSTPINQLFNRLACNNIISAVGMIFRPEFFVTGGFDESYRNLEDWPAWLRITRNQVRIPCFTEPTMCYSMSGISSSQQTAFDSDILKPDLIHCFETEILPFTRLMPYWTRRYVQYQYARLFRHQTLSKKCEFFLRYPLFELYRRSKAGVKKWIFARRHK